MEGRGVVVVVMRGVLRAHMITCASPVLQYCERGGTLLSRSFDSGHIRWEPLGPWHAAVSIRLRSVH